VNETHTEHSIPPKGHDAHVHKEYSLLSLDPGVGIWAVITFVALLIILKKFAWSPIINSLDEREKRLQSSLKTAEDARNESKRIAEEQKRILAEARDEAATIMSNARRSAEEFKQKIETSAKSEKEKIISSAESEIRTMTDAAVRDLRNASVDLAIGATEKLLHTSLNEQNSRKLVEQYIEEMESEA
jgi:F-type H+-transporting ATPase subunit b